MVNILEDIIKISIKDIYYMTRHRDGLWNLHFYYIISKY